MSVHLGTHVWSLVHTFDFFWQSNQEIQEEIDEGRTTGGSCKGVSNFELK
jgi:hypothetical protein